MNNKKVKSNIVYVTFEIDALHRWNPEYVGKQPPAGQEYLVHPHRHLFKWQVQFKQTASRDIEFLDAKITCKKAVKRGMDVCQHQIIDGNAVYEASCEDFAMSFVETLYHIDRLLHDAIHSVEVSEDGENGAIITF